MAGRHFLVAGIVLLATILLPFFSGQAWAAGDLPPRSASLAKARVTWEDMPGAVAYRVAILEKETDSPQKALKTYRAVYAPGLEFPTEWLGEKAATAFWTVAGFDRDGNPVGEWQKPSPLRDAETQLMAPLPIDEYDRMAYLPVYPVYAWLAVPRASSYEVEVWRRQDDGREERARHYYSYETILYETVPFTQAGAYWWRVRALDGNGRRYSDWSVPRAMTVTAPTPIAALGDSITHGGGACSTPPCRQIYNWETYCSVPVKNIGVSGDSPEAMCERFETDVLPFAPQVLVIMGGVNDYRVGLPADDSIYYLNRIAEKCQQNGITPVFVTATPIHPALMARLEEIEPVAENWQAEQRRLNEWIRSQPHAIDITASLTDETGRLRQEMTSDGLHPDYLAKKSMGETIGAYLTANFPEAVRAARENAAAISPENPATGPAAKKTAVSGQETSSE
ncbi:MAG: SGNH/GDSL hydrolase family protein [Schwartzia sp.]|nr:SGNH/GDSL hydrolase family protein [Schwartzia sp. (in: firmicutes)]